MDSTPDLVAGVLHDVMYVGSIGVTVSMKILHYDERSILAKECIVRLGEASSLIRVNRDRPRARNLADYVEPRIDRRCLQAQLLISTRYFQIQLPHEQGVIARHKVFNVSFATGGEDDTSTFVAYVASDVDLGDGARRCHVFQCESTEGAWKLLETIRDAFSTGFHTKMRQLPIADAGVAATWPKPPELCLRTAPRLPSRQDATNENATTPGNRDYYNDLNKLSRSPPPPHQDGGALIDLETVVQHTGPGMAEGAAFDYGASTCLVRINHDLLSTQPYYHPLLSREQTESLLQRDGDFLVRRSPGLNQAQFVLSGRHEGVFQHLLLIDHESGGVRTRDRQFKHVPDLIQYYRQHNLPISTPQGVLLLRHPIPPPALLPD